MITKPICCELEINAVPLEKMEYNHSSTVILCVDDINEYRWQIVFKEMQAMRFLTKECGYNYNTIDFTKYYYVDDSGIRHFRNNILQVENSDWIKYLQKDLDRNSDIFKELGISRHYIVTLYDYILEIIAGDISIKKL